MRLLTFSFLKTCKFKSIIYPGSRHCASQSTGHNEISVEKYTADPSLVEISSTWPLTEEPEMRVQVAADMRVFPNFVSEIEETSLMNELEPQLKRMRYEFDHWDNAIEGYRETERSEWRAENAAVLARVRALAFEGAQGDARREGPLPHAHVLDLAAAGHIKPHVDATRFCGDVIAGVCLLSGAVMRLQHTRHPALVLTALLPRRALYIMKGVARYEFTHGVPLGAESVWRGVELKRARRVAVITRSQPRPIQPSA